MPPTTRPHLGTIHNVEALQLGLHPLNNPPSTATNAGVLYNRHQINRAGTIEIYRAFEIEAVFAGLVAGEQHDVMFASSRQNPQTQTDDPVAESAADTWRTTGIATISLGGNTLRFTVAGADLFTVRLLNPVNGGVARSISFYATKYRRSDS